MRRYLLVGAALAGVVVVTYALVDALGIALLNDPRPWLGGGVASGAVGVGLLIVDVVLPVPSSVVMIAHGTLFGVLLGAALSVVGSTGGAMLAFWLGRRGGPVLSRLVSAEERARAEGVLTRWGLLAVIVTRPVPVLAETVALLAGASALRWWKVLGAAAVGVLPPAVVYAAVGAAVIDAAPATLVFVLVLLLAGLTSVGAVAVERVTARRRQRHVDRYVAAEAT